MMVRNRATSDRQGRSAYDKLIMIVIICSFKIVEGKKRDGKG